MAEWWARNQFERPVPMLALAGLITSALTLGAWAIAAADFAVYHVFLSALYGLPVPFMSLRPKQIAAAFPPGMGIDEKRKVWRIVRNGGPVDDLTTAPAVAHHAKWQLGSGGSNTPMLVTVFIAGLFVTQATFNENVSNDTTLYFLAGALLVIMVLFTALAVQRGRKAQRTLKMIEAQSGASDD